MWSFLKPAHFIATARAIILGVIAAFAFTIATPDNAAAQPVEYVKVCSFYGAFFLFEPGSNTCVNTSQIQANQFAIARLNTLSSTGTAMAASLVAPWLPTGTNYAISNHWANFNGQNGIGVSGLMRLSGNLVFSAGFGLGLDNGSLRSNSYRQQVDNSVIPAEPQQSWSDLRGLSRAGFMYAW